MASCPTRWGAAELAQDIPGDDLGVWCARPGNGVGRRRDWPQSATWGRSVRGAGEYALGQHSRHSLVRERGQAGCDQCPDDAADPGGGQVVGRRHGSGLNTHRICPYGLTLTGRLTSCRWHLPE